MKRSRKSLILVILLAFFVAGYAVLQHLPVKETTVYEETGIYLIVNELNKADLSLTALKWATDDTSYTLTKADEVWTSDAYPVNQSEMQTLSDDFLSLRATRRTENISSLSDYGITEDAFSVAACFSDGSEIVYTLGAQTPFQDGYYLATSNSDTIVYTIASSLDSILDVSLSDLVEKESLPEIDHVTHLTVTSPDTCFDANWLAESLTLSPDQHWYDTETQVPLSDSSLESMIASIQGLSWSSLVTPTASQDELASYSLTDDTATILSAWDAEEEVFRLLVGTTLSGARTVRLPDSSMVYTVTAASLSSLLSANTADLRVTTVVPLSYDQLASAAFSLDRGTYTVLGPEKETDSEETVTEETVSSVSADETAQTKVEDTDSDDSDEELWTALTALNITEYLPDVLQGEEVLSVAIRSVDDQSMNLLFTEYSADTYQVILDGTQAGLVEADRIDTLVRRIKSLLASP